MTWTAPITYVTGDVVTAAAWNGLANDIASMPKGRVAAGSNAGSTTLSTTANTETTAATANSFTYISGQKYLILGTARVNAGVAGALVDIRVRTVAAGTQLTLQQALFSTTGGTGQQDILIEGESTSLSGALSLVLTGTVSSAPTPASAVSSCSFQVYDMGT